MNHFLPLLHHLLPAVYIIFNTDHGKYETTTLKTTSKNYLYRNIFINHGFSNYSGKISLTLRPP